MVGLQMPATNTLINASNDISCWPNQINPEENKIDEKCKDIY